MKKSIIIFFGVFVFYYANSQDIKELHTNFRFAPLSMFDPFRTVFQPGLELIYNEKIGLGFDYGFQFDLLKFETTKYNRKYFKTRFEIKYFVSQYKTNKTAKFLPYFGLETFYIPDRYTKYDDFLYLGEYIIQYETAEVEKYALGFIGKCGFETIFNNRFLLDFNLAAGFKYRKHVTIAENGIIDEDNFFEEWYSDPDRNPGIRKTPFFTFSFKIGYVLFTK